MTDEDPITIDIPVTIGVLLTKCELGHTYAVSLGARGTQKCPVCRTPPPPPGGAIYCYQHQGQCTTHHRVSDDPVRDPSTWSVVARCGLVLTGVRDDADGHMELLFRHSSAGQPTGDFCPGCFA